MAHEEFPPLTEQAKRVLIHTMKKLDVFKPCWDRRLAAALIREGLEQVSPGRDFLAGSLAHQLNCLCDNLHALPPAPPTREEMDEALRGLLSLVDYHPGSKCDAWTQTLQRGIAHHCKVQP